MDIVLNIEDIKIEVQKEPKQEYFFQGTDVIKVKTVNGVSVMDESNDDKITRILDNYVKAENNDSEDENMLNTDSEVCDVCEKDVSKNNRARHRKSKSHIFNLNKSLPVEQEKLSSAEFKQVLELLEDINVCLLNLMKKEIVIKCVS